MSCTYQCQCPRPSSVRLKLSLSARIEKINRVTERQGNRERGERERERERESGDGSESSSVRLTPLLPRAQNEELTDRERREESAGRARERRAIPARVRQTL